ncbi:TetR/AcrR family transcriptional regulator [Actinoplanes sp. TRM 88003]|uniref:TetR/AcrR family transcriptional regulator n=1 Tax=Paractinoplanes aksuensis TaxID=2939490 RepID=A0ABT1DTX9_9ACTN|nr:TetR/AcrR family transcriptional regulator [Actinoplanes aksuensis]MCO8274306.1 TetR/AcrR family transcriptional regulator [Actinoplanes aksuensis]
MSTRERIVTAAAEVIRDRGLARATTKEIARAAGLSEAALYKHFRDKTDIFLAVLAERGPTNLVAVLGALPERVGREPLTTVLRDVVLAAANVYDQAFPMAASLFAEPALLAAHRTALSERGIGPQIPSQALAAYLHAEQQIGRVSEDADPTAAAMALLGACFHRAFLGHFTEHSTDLRKFATTLIETVLAGLTPRP